MKILAKGTHFWPEQTPAFDSIQSLYEAGFAGTYFDPEEKEALIAENIAIHGFGSLDDAATSNNWAGSGAGKLSLPYITVLERYPKAWPGPSQVEGDCFLEGTMVRMADGSEKAIEHIKVGEQIASPFGGSRKVTNTFNKYYNGDIYTIRSKNYSRKVECTPDHRFVSYSGDNWGWVNAENLESVLIPTVRLEEQTHVFDLANAPNVITEGVYARGSVRRVEHGYSQPVKDKTTRPFSGLVYCIEVEHDHAFIANGYAVHNCVGRNAANAALFTMCNEVAFGQPDEVTGKREDYPEVSALGERNGVISPEAIYWWRRSASHGWYCGAACRVMQKESGLWVRQNYQDLGIDLTQYTKGTVNRFGRTPPTGKIAEQGVKNLVRAFAECKTREARRDSLANGYGLVTCGTEAFSNKRDQWGVSSRAAGTWAHAMTPIAFDDRQDTKGIYGDSLELYLNSWGIWNSGSRDIRDSAKFVPPEKKQLWISLGIVNAQTGNILIPEGSCWMRSRDVANREVFALSSVNGWLKKKLPDWGVSLAG